MLTKIAISLGVLTASVIIIGAITLYFIDIPPPKAQTELTISPLPKPKISL